MRPLLLLAVAAAIVGGAVPGTTRSAGAQEPTEKTVAERLGYPRDAKLLVVHADDLGMTHSVNMASIKGLETGLISSASIMVPCPWFPEIAEYAKSHPDADLGLHLTLTSEWKAYRWGPVLPTDQVKSLVAPDGYFYPAADIAAAHIDPREAEAEIRAQVKRAFAFGVRPTHLDSHMGTLYQNPDLVKAWVKVARDFKLPIPMTKEYIAQTDFLKSIVRPDEVLFDRTINASPSLPPDRWAAFYANAIKNLQPGVTLVTIHLAYDDEEMRAVTDNYPNWGAAWRQRDFDFFTSDAFRRLLQENGIKLVTYRELATALRPTTATSIPYGDERCKRHPKCVNRHPN